MSTDDKINSLKCGIYILFEQNTSRANEFPICVSLTFGTRAMCVRYKAMGLKPLRLSVDKILRPTNLCNAS